MKERSGSEELLIVGGGLAGAAAACVLSQAGCPALLIERETTPRHKVCGEFLSIEAQAYLAHLGVDLDDLGASRISSVRLIHGRVTAEVALPFTGRGLSRMSLDEALLKRASFHGTRIVEGVALRALSVDAQGLRAEIGDPGDVHARTLFLATGKHDVRGAKRPFAGSAQDLIGFKMHYLLRDGQRSGLEGSVEVALFPGGYAGLQLVERGIANLCLVVTRQCFQEVGKSWHKLLEFIAGQTPQLSHRMDGAVPLFVRPLSIFQVPYGFVHSPHRAEPQGLFRIGDQAGVIPSYTGDGMAIALHSGCLAASTYLEAGQAGSLFHHRLRTDISHQIRLASLFYEAGRQTVGQKAILQLCRTWPSVMRYVASLTRIGHTAVERVLVRT